MAILNDQVSVGTTATKIIDTSSDGLDAPFDGTVVNHDAAVDIFVGGSGVTTSNGAKVAADGTVGVKVREGDVLYGIVASGTATAGYVGTDYLVGD